ncbi:MAG TPA: UDP-N-acetylglucosamine--N-acetylmuramyl-(pentapeptide) pyrophosphoryl-undecaprenol N-acetylglucosamine transferase [Elusimicrobiota bacterium]|nr:UDP-N-acetylglucosamine--N-acetylmuramyl-(pentapeptide) pyrophosphoryl-undecaprenol N-acetylglucosamine transferase [Elusimicrobiota bacterium]
MRIAIACGGTGGHFYPGYVLGKTLRARGHEVLFVLRTQDPAAARLEAEDLPFIELDLRGMPRSLSPALLSFAWKLAGSLRTARAVVRSWRPAAAAGMGGYLTFPLAAAARAEGVPFLLHESNAVMGLANRLLGRWARIVALGLPPAGAAPAHARLVGTPVRPELWRRGEPAAARKELGLEDRPTLLVFGGSQGARAINRLLPPAVASMKAARPQVLHLSGPAAEEETRAAYAAAGVAAQVRGYCARMDQAYAAADVVLCRSGASTLAELAAQAKPALLVPYPFAAENHQEVNARLWETAGAGRLLREKELSAEGLARTLGELFGADGAGKRAAMSDAYPRLGLPPAESCADRLADAVEALGSQIR